MCTFLSDTMAHVIERLRVARETIAIALPRQRCESQQGEGVEMHCAAFDTGSNSCEKHGSSTGCQFHFHQETKEMRLPWKYELKQQLAVLKCQKVARELSEAAEESAPDLTSSSTPQPGLQFCPLASPRVVPPPSRTTSNRPPPRAAVTRILLLVLPPTVERDRHLEPLPRVGVVGSLGAANVWVRVYMYMYVFIVTCASHVTYNVSG